MMDKASKRQQEIIESAGKLLMEKGIKGLTTKNLAQEMEFSESALYRHFKNKEDIILLLIRFLSENINLRFETILKVENNAEEKFLALFLSQFQFFKKNPHFIVIVLSDGLMDNSEDIKKSIKKLIETNFVALKKIMTDGQESKLFNQEMEADSLVHFAMGTFRLQMLQWKLSNFNFDIEIKGMKTMTDLLTLLKK
ncbi:TetR/AcrR family transcriptional regulator [Flavobacterium facile]|uniref:TetR/AcrR family transcriptional regulator n=1 Tax=Flavobacterium facile TaxID=2893174 RepID=UPI002E7A58FE|nr:TetR/AcrR family transcriptional regulator [Flavobacterium sp. T-12]